MSRLHDLHALGQSIWLDYIRRSFTRSGGLAALVADGVRGVTSNPTIFQKAIAGGDDYDEQLREVARSVSDPEGIFEELAVTDIREAADVLRPLYEESAGEDGYVSLEVSPTLAHDTEGTVAAARRLATAVDRPNLMIKIPATEEGIPAIRSTLAAGINVNVTLIFAIERYAAVVDAFTAGLEDYVAAGGDASAMASVASFFVSRIDSAVDERLEGSGADDLRGAIAIDNARLAYARSRELFSGERWQKLAAAGAREQRLLWASTGTKNPAYPDTRYVDELIGRPTVNTVPPATLDAFRDHGTVAQTITKDLGGARARMARLAEVGVSFDTITAELEAAGVKSFADSYESLLASVQEKAARIGAV